MTDDTRLDALVRAGMQAVPQPDDLRTLAALDVVRRAGRRPSTPRVAALAAAAALLVVAALVLRTWWSPEQAPEPAPAPGDLRGSWTRPVEVPGRGAWTGSWTMTFTGGGVLSLDAPEGAGGVGDGASFAVDGAQVRVDALVNDDCYELRPGRYAWTSSGDALRLSVVDDPCEVRMRLLAGTWSRVP